MRARRCMWVAARTLLLVAAIAEQDYLCFAAQEERGVAFSSKPKEWQFIPDLALSGEGAAVVGSELHRDAILRRNAEVDFLRKGNLVLSFHWGDRTLMRDGPTDLGNSLEYIGVGYDTPKGRVKGFVRHTCNHVIGHKQGNTMRWNELGVGFVTEGARLGHFNDGIPRDRSNAWLLRPHLDASASLVGYTTDTDYFFRTQGKVREDIYRFGPHIFYAQAGWDWFAGGGTPWGVNVELGDRIMLFPKLDLTLFLSYERVPNPFGARTDPADALLLGARLSTRSPESFTLPRNELPDLRVTGSYAPGLNKPGSDGEVDLGLGIGRVPRLSLWGNGAIKFLTGGDLAPRRTVYEAGPTLRFEEENYRLDLGHRYVSAHITNKEETDHPHYHTLTATLATHGMDVRNWDRKWASRGAADRPSSLNGSVSAGVFLAKNNFDYDGFVGAAVRWDALRFGSERDAEGEGKPYVLYLRGEVRSHFGDGILFGHCPEIGIRRAGRAASFSVYFRHHRNLSPIQWEKNEDRYTVGVRFDY